MAQTGSLRAFGPGGGTADQLNVTIDLGSRDARSRSSEEITRALRRDLVGIPGVIARARAAGDQFNINRAIGGPKTRSRSRSEDTTWPTRHVSPTRSAP